MRRLLLALLCVLLPASVAQAQQPGIVVFEFADGHESHYTIARPPFRARGWTGVAAINPSNVGQPGRLTEDQLRRLYNVDGWDVMSHGWTHEDPTLMTPEELDEHLRLSHDWLLDHEFTRSARHYGPPLGCDARVREAATEYYDLIRHFGECKRLPEGYDYRQTGVHDAIPWHRIRRRIDAVTDSDQALLLTFHQLVEGDAGGGQTSRARFGQVIRYVERRGLRVATFSDLLVTAE